MTLEGPPSFLSGLLRSKLRSAIASSFTKARVAWALIHKTMRTKTFLFAGVVVLIIVGITFWTGSRRRLHQPELSSRQETQPKPRSGDHDESDRSVTAGRDQSHSRLDPVPAPQSIRAILDLTG